MATLPIQGKFWKLCKKNWIPKISYMCMEWYIVLLVTDQRARCYKSILNPEKTPKKATIGEKSVLDLEKFKVSHLCSYDVQKNYRHARTSGTWNQAIPRLAFLAIFRIFSLFQISTYFYKLTRACGCRAHVKIVLGARRDYSWIICKNRVHSRDS